jgi:gamma-aminobutyric acid type B receptor
MFKGSATVRTAQRMSSVLEGVCAPVHMNLETWAAGIKTALDVYANESYNAGGVGYYGISGIYTTNDFVDTGLDEAQFNPVVFANYWKHYQYDDRVIDTVNASAFFNNTKYYPPADNGCAEEDDLGCRDSCAMSLACKERKAAGGECLIVVMMYANYDRGYFQAAMSNLDIPAYFCFIGYDATAEYALEAQLNGSAVLFYHFEPDMFHIKYSGLFQRVMLPRALPERVAVATGTYGENGYGEATNNPVDVDFPSNLLMKYAASLLSDLPIGPVLSKFTLTDLDIKDIMVKYKDAAADGAITDPSFDAACSWVKENYDVWRLWLERLPLCTFDEHISHTVSGCNGTNTNREIDFKWNMPNPDNESLPYACDGGYAELPSSLITSRSCEWITEHTSTWVPWIESKPECDSTFYEYYVTDCDSNAERTIKYRWLLPLSTDATMSAECENGYDLPSDITINCEYLPYSSPVFTGATALTGIEFLLLVAALAYVYIHRDAPIIKRSQYELLMLMIFGGLFTSGAAVAYAGRPTDALCALRPILISLGFTSLFGALVIKSLRVYRVFMQKAMKRTTITLRMMLKVLVIFYLIDISIFTVWGVADFPRAEMKDEVAKEIQGPVSRIACRSSSFIFTALLMFWKAILLFSGLYLSFLIRKVSVDFQESMWIFSSALVVLFACLVILPLAYIVDMSAGAFYAFLAGVLILSTAMVVSLMLVPKVLRIKEADSSKQSAVAYSAASSEATTTTEVVQVGPSKTSAKYAVKSSVKPTVFAAKQNGIQVKALTRPSATQNEETEDDK